MEMILLSKAEEEVLYKTQKHYKEGKQQVMKVIIFLLF